jgi:hypothetical protein
MPGPSKSVRPIGHSDKWPNRTVDFIASGWYKPCVKTGVAVLLSVLVFAPVGIAVGVAKDPRVPPLQRRVRALETKAGFSELRQNSLDDQLKALKNRFDLVCKTIEIDSARAFQDPLVKTMCLIFASPADPCREARGSSREHRQASAELR